MEKSPLEVRVRSDVRIVGLMVIVITAAVFWPVLGFDFINFDDPVYVTGNGRVPLGLTADNVGWAFRARPTGFWQPLTLLSLLLDGQIYGLNPRGFHLTNLLLLAGNAGLLFYLLVRLTGSVGKSGFVAALFAIHPLHVESVAWVSERKDVLSGLLGLLALHAYVSYGRKSSGGWYLLTAGLLALGLMAKPMLVSWPLVMLLLDYWPMGRLNGTNWKRRVAEKIPLAALAAVSCVVTYVTQHQGVGDASFVNRPWGQRIPGALANYGEYLIKTVYPKGLAILYPYDPNVAPEKVALGAGLLVAVSLAVALRFRSRRYLAVGWFWYVLTFLPVIGLVAVGEFSRADRYTYLPLIGIFLMAAWGPSDLAAWIFGRLSPRVTAVAAGVILIGFAGTTRRQVGYWSDSITVFDRALAVTRDNYIAHNNLGNALLKAQQRDQAREHYQKAIAINPRYAEAYHNLGVAALDAGDLLEASLQLNRALEIKPDYAGAHCNLGIVAARRRNWPMARDHFQKALAIDPELLPAQVNLVMTLCEGGRYAEAWEQVRLIRKRGAEVPPELLAELALKMPEPKEQPADYSR